MVYIDISVLTETESIGMLTGEIDIPDLPKVGEFLKIGDNEDSTTSAENCEQHINFE